MIKGNHLFSSQTRTIILVTIISVSLAVYFSFSIIILPILYSRLPKFNPIPVLINVNLSSSVGRLGKTFLLTIMAENQGDSADVQIVSISFPNLTQMDGLVQIKQSDFTQKPLFVRVGEKVGSGYVGQQNLVTAEYPSLEAFSRPWHAHVSHHIQLEVKPPLLGRFVLFVKMIALPHVNDFAHYPHGGSIKDYQNEFVKVYSITVMKN